LNGMLNLQKFGGGCAVKRLISHRLSGIWLVRSTSIEIGKHPLQEWLKEVGFADWKTIGFADWKKSNLLIERQSDFAGELMAIEIETGCVLHALLKWSALLKWQVVGLGKVVCGLRTLRGVIQFVWTVAVS
jgi:hypothetical protein